MVKDGLLPHVSVLMGRARTNGDLEGADALMHCGGVTSHSEGLRGVTIVSMGTGDGRGAGLLTCGPVPGAALLSQAEAGLVGGAQTQWSEVRGYASHPKRDAQCFVGEVDKHQTRQACPLACEPSAAMASHSKTNRLSLPWHGSSFPKATVPSGWLMGQALGCRPSLGPRLLPGFDGSPATQPQWAQSL